MALQNRVSRFFVDNQGALLAIAILIGLVIVVGSCTASPRGGYDRWRLAVVAAGSWRLLMLAVAGLVALLAPVLARGTVRLARHTLLHLAPPGSGPLLADLIAGLMPTAVRCQVGGAVEPLATLRTSVLEQYDAGAAMLRQPERVFEFLPAQLAVPPITFGMAASSARTSSDTSTRLNCGSMSPDSRGESPLRASSSEMMIVPETGDEFSSSNFSFRMALARRSFDPPLAPVTAGGFFPLFGGPCVAPLLPVGFAGVVSSFAMSTTTVGGSLVTSHLTRFGSGSSAFGNGDGVAGGVIGAGTAVAVVTWRTVKSSGLSPMLVAVATILVVVLAGRTATSAYCSLYEGGRLATVVRRPPEDTRRDCGDPEDSCSHSCKTGRAEVSAGGAGTGQGAGNDRVFVPAHLYQLPQEETACVRI
uniref:Uncharacterized protein n=1 Tax=Anopheles atroparvus TaxID=41427 RepID=A0A182JCI7_ANOAO